MKILQIATLNRPIRRDLGYGPIETVIYNLDKGLQELGHRSLVACSGDSRISGEGYTTLDHSFKEYWTTNTLLQRHEIRRHLVLSLERARRVDIDIVHLHDPAMTEFIFKGMVACAAPVVMTLHVPAEEEGSFWRWNRSLVGSSAVYFVPISDFQRRQNRGLINMQDVIHHGIDPEGFPPAGPPGKQDYLFSIGRITRDKGQDKAIEVARRTGSRLVVAGNVQNKKEDQDFFESLRPTFDLVIKGDFSVADEHYYDRVMRPILASDRRIIYVGEVNSGQKKLWYQHARATLFPIQWGEPFGLVLIESLASGTPVVAFRRGSVPEIVNHGKTGFVVDTLDEMIEAVKAIRLIDPGDCRRHVQDHFSINTMARKYASLYRQLLNKGLSCHETSP